jgi:hypothetical protein
MGRDSVDGVDGILHGKGYRSHSGSFQKVPSADHFSGIKS